MNISFNSRYLIDIASQIEDNTITIILKDSGSPESHFQIEHVANYELNLVVANDQTLHQLNLEHLGEDFATDVLAFPFLVPFPKEGGWGLEQPDSDFVTASNITEGDEDYLHMGEVVLSYERAVDQAKDHDKEPKDEIALLIIHGILHLFGYDHAEDVDQQTMWRLQQSILNDLGSRGIL